MDARYTQERIVSGKIQYFFLMWNKKQSFQIGIKRLYIICQRDNRTDTVFYLQVQRDFPTPRELRTDACTGTNWGGGWGGGLQPLCKLSTQDFLLYFIIEERSLSHVLFNHLAHQGDTGTLFQKFYNFSSTQEKLKVSASKGVCQDCFETR